MVDSFGALKFHLFKRYFTHGVSHNLGLDTHDYGDLSYPITKNMVFTVEPGIYLPKENFGIRLEDDDCHWKSSWRRYKK